MPSQDRDGPATNVAKLTSTGGAGLSIAIGLVAFIGWSFGLPALTAFFSVHSAMQPVTAMCAIVGGVAILSARKTGTSRRLSSVAATVVVLAAVQTLIEYSLRVDLGTDQLLFAGSVRSQSISYPHPGRMAAPTAVAFLLIGAAVLLSHVRGRVAGLLLSACGTAVLILVVVALLGHTYMVALLTGALGFTQVAIPTALALGGLSVGVLALRPHDGWVRLLIGSSVGATAARWLLPTVVAVPIVVASLALRGSEIGLYPSDFRLAFTTAVTIVLLASLALWGAWQLDRLVAIRRSAEALQESEATLRAFFDTEGLFASIVEQQGDDIRYVAANTAYSNLFGRDDVAGSNVRDVHPGFDGGSIWDRLGAIAASGKPLSLEQSIDTEAGTRWFAVTISPVAARLTDPPRFATAAFEITGRKQAETQQELLNGELAHRLKNTLSVIQAIATQTLGRRADEDVMSEFSERLGALGRAHDVLTTRQWSTAVVAELADSALSSFNRERFDLDGPDVTIGARAALSLSLLLHELATNATKHGALSVAEGKVTLRWDVDERGDDRTLHMTWRERGGPPAKEPSRKGFGSRIIRMGLTGSGGTEADYSAEGLTLNIEAPLSQLQQP